MTDLVNEETIIMSEPEGSVICEPIKRVKRPMSDAQKANLEKARAVKRANITKRPLEKRKRAEELHQLDIDKAASEKAKALAEDIIKSREQEKELEEYRKWKKEIGDSKEIAPEKEKKKQNLKQVPSKKEPVKVKKPRKPPSQNTTQSQDEMPKEGTTSFLTATSHYQFDDFLS